MQLEEEDRRVIPRWRDSATTFSTGELASLTARTAPLVIADDYLREKVEQWHAHGTISFATDLISAAIAIGRDEEAKDAAEFVLENGSLVSVSALYLAGRVLQAGNVVQQTKLEPHCLDINNEQDTRRLVHDIRGKLMDEPRNSLLWVDLSRQYAILGLPDQAIRAMTTAIKLAGDNRFVLRSASRLFVHVNQPDQAIVALHKSNATRYDPWLLAADMALSGRMGEAPRFIKQARAVLGNHSIPDFHKSELASAIGTLELMNGRSRTARRHFLDALTVPTDNSVAQADWASRKISGVVIEEKHLQIPRAFEAKTLESYWSENWEEAYLESLLWLDDEPFSVNPAVFASFISGAILNNYDRSVDIAKKGLSANPDDPMLKNNLIYALACGDRLSEAEAELATVNFRTLGGPPYIAMLATDGLLRFRKNLPEEGRLLYQRASELADRSNEAYVYASVLAFWAREEVAASTHAMFEVLERAKNASAAVKNPTAKRLIRLAEAEANHQVE